MRNHPEAARLNKIISDEQKKIKDRVYELDQLGRPYTLEEVFSPIGKGATLVECIRDYAERKAINNARKYENLADKILQFKPDIYLKDVTVPFVDSFKKWLQGQDRINSIETVNRYIKFLKTVLNEQYKLHNYDDRQVLSYRTPTGRGNKVKLSRDEFESIAKKDVGPALELSRDCFCLMVYMRGLRISDMLQLKISDIIDERAIFNEQKTGKAQDIKLRSEALKIIDRWKDQSLWYVLPILMLPPSDPRTDREYQKHIEVKTSMVNKDLKLVAALAGVHKHLTTHVARHSFATWADRSGLTSREIQKLLNHSSLSVTETYLQQLRKSSELDDAADKVFG